MKTKGQLDSCGSLNYILYPQYKLLTILFKICERAIIVVHLYFKILVISENGKASFIPLGI